MLCRFLQNPQTQVWPLSSAVFEKLGSDALILVLRSNKQCADIVVFAQADKTLYPVPVLKDIGFRVGQVVIPDRGLHFFPISGVHKGMGKQTAFQPQSR